MKTLIVGFVIVITAAGCSTMDEVKVSHPCEEPLTLVIEHLEPDGTGGQTYVAETWSEVAGPDEVSVVAGIINLGANDLVRLVVDISGWEVEISRAQLRDRDGLITLPPEGCPS